MSETRTVYVAYTNTDCTEGRGRDVPIAVCEMEITALRLAKKRYVQGSDGPVLKMDLVMIDGKWYAPSSAIQLIAPTEEDRVLQKRLDATRAAAEKAKAAGLSQDEIDLLTGYRKL